MTRIELHEELTSFAEVLADRLAAKLAETLPGSFENFKQQRDFALLQARAKAQAELGKMIEAASVREAEAEREAQRKREARAELERTIDRSLLTSQELEQFLSGGAEPLDYAQRLEIKRQQQEEAELMKVDATLLTDEEAEIYFARQELPPDYRARAIAAREKRREQHVFALAYRRPDLMDEEELKRFRREGIVPDDFESRLEAAQASASATGKLPGAELRGR